LGLRFIKQLWRQCKITKWLQYRILSINVCLGSELGQLFSQGLEFRSISGFSSLLKDIKLLLVEVLGSFLSLGFQSFNKSLFLPANRGAEITNGAVLSIVLQSQNLKGSRDNLSLNGIVRSWDTFEDLQSSYTLKQRLISNIPKAAAPLGVLCGSIPLMALQTSLDGDL